jgi:HSP20 family protein
MALVRWQPASLFDLRNDMNRVFDTFRGNGPASDASRPAQWRPSVDITDGRLTLRGERRHDSEESDGSVHRIERVYGAFTRSFDLPDAVKEDQIEATYLDGVLSVTVPKAEEVKPRQIEVKIST